VCPSWINGCDPFACLRTSDFSILNFHSPSTYADCCRVSSRIGRLIFTSGLYPKSTDLCHLSSGSDNPDFLRVFGFRKFQLKLKLQCNLPEACDLSPHVSLDLTVQRPSALWLFALRLFGSSALQNSCFGSSTLREFQTLMHPFLRSDFTRNT
jgi:hypothetical protein